MNSKYHFGRETRIQKFIIFFLSKNVIRIVFYSYSMMLFIVVDKSMLRSKNRII